MNKDILSCNDKIKTIFKNKRDNITIRAQQKRIKSQDKKLDSIQNFFTLVKFRRQTETINIVIKSEICGKIILSGLANKNL